MHFADPTRRQGAEAATGGTARAAIGSARANDAASARVEQIGGGPALVGEPPALPARLRADLIAGASCDELGAAAGGAELSASLLASLPARDLPSRTLTRAPTTPAGLAWLTRIAEWATDADVLRRTAQIASLTKLPARALFDAIARHPSQDPVLIHALRRLLVHLVPGFAVDPKVQDASWRTTTRLADACARALAEPALLAQIDQPRMHAVDQRQGKHGPVYSEDLSAGMTLERRLLRLEDLRGVLGVAVNPIALQQQLGKKDHPFDWKHQGAGELQRIADQGYRTLRISINVPVQPEQLGPLADFFRQIVAYNSAHPEPGQKLKLMIVAGFSGGLDGPGYGLTAAENDEHAHGSAAKHKVADVGRQFGHNAAAMVKQLIATYGLGGAIAGVELGNEPQVQWRTKHAPYDEATRDSELDTAAVTAFDHDAAGTGVAGLPAAPEWDPASEQNLIREVYDRVQRGGVDPSGVQQLVMASPWARAIDAYALASASPDGKPKTVALAIHVYNSPLLARAAIATIAAIAARHHLMFSVSVTELQIDSYSHHPPGADNTRRLAAGAVDLGTQVMDEAARHASYLKIANLLLFSWHHVGDQKQDFGLRDNPDLTKLLGKRA